MDDGNSKTTRLLTLLNVSAIKTGKRKRIYDDKELQPSVKLNKRKPDPEPIEQENYNELEEAENPEDVATKGQEEGERIRAEGMVRFTTT